MSKSKGERQLLVAPNIPDIFLLFRIRIFQILLIFIITLRSERSHIALSRIPVTDIAQSCGVNAMKVSER